MNQPSKPGQQAPAPSMRELMPETSAWVDRRRLEFGRDHVAQCIRMSRPHPVPTQGGQAMAPGEPGWFYAMENGHVIGTPFPPGNDVAKWQDFALATGCTFAVFMATPASKEGPDGTH